MSTGARPDPFPNAFQRIRRAGTRLTERVGDDPGRVAEALVSVVVVALATFVVLATLHPTAMWRDTTPTGGDMGAHVWGPRYLLDHVLPTGRLTSWTPDWYNGFPAYQFYMVVPSLLIVILHVGLVWPLAVVAVLAAAGAIYAAWSHERLYRYRFVVLSIALAVAVLAVPTPYNRAFKLITAIGLIGMPIAAWAAAKLADLPFPIPPLASAASLVFLYNREPLYNSTGNIIGGNFHSTMAGEFAFSVSLTLAVLYLGVAARGLRTGRHRALAAVLFALAGLCHLIPAFFVLACTAALFVLHPDRQRFRWLVTMVPVAGLLTAFWVLPFWWQRDYVNDMGWERLPHPGAELSDQGKLLAGDQGSVLSYLFPTGLRWLLVAALVGVVVSVVRRYAIGMTLALSWVSVMVAFTFMPQARLWNARLLPFLYLSVSLLAAIGVGEVIRLAGAFANGRPHRPFRPITVGVASLVAVGTLLYVTLPLTGLFDGVYDQEQVTHDGETKTKRSFLEVFSTRDTNGIQGWSAWNYAGLEAKKAQPDGCASEGRWVREAVGTAPVACTSGGWPEYRDLMATMASLGEDPDHGCGRAFWEYAKDRVNGYGTPMAPMLLPYWTDGCIGSQEGLYFESSATVPHHFLMQAQLSEGPSQPQREMPYPSFDMDAGVENLQLLGVRYYVATTPTAVEAAAAHPDLTEVAVSGAWHVYEVADSPAVEALAHEPVVVTGVDGSQQGWLPTATAWFLGDDRDVFLAQDGPEAWERVEAEPVPEDERRLVRWTRDLLGLSGPMDQVPETRTSRLPAVEVSDVDIGRDRIAFRVSEPGVPVLVKTSYFPNWEVEGADGPYRVTPNLMVVVPTHDQVTLTYGRQPIDLIATGMTLLGLVGLVLLARAGRVEVTPETPSRASRALDRMVQIRRPEPGDADAEADVFTSTDPPPPSTPPAPPAGSDAPSPFARRPATRIGNDVGPDGAVDDDDIWTVDPPSSQPGT